MALQTPSTAKKISQQAKLEVRREIQSSDPFLARSYLGGIISSISNRVFEFYDSLRESELESNPFTAIRLILKHAAGYGMSQAPGASATGQAFVNASSGGVGTIIPSATRYVAGGGNVYVQTGDATLGALVFSILAANMTAAGTTVTIVTSSAHGLASNAVMTMTGGSADYAAVDKLITVIAANTFTYEADTGPSVTPSLVAGVANFVGATVAVNSIDAGTAFDLGGDTALAFETPIALVETPALATFTGVVDGTNLETELELRARMIDHIQNPNTPFNVAEISRLILAISGVTRVFVQEQTPQIGGVTAYFIRDEDDDPIPGTVEVAEALAIIQAIRPAHTSPTDVQVLAPTAVPTDFTFTAASLVPDTPTMRIAIANQLAEFFKRNTDVAVNITEDAYRSAIYNTVDTLDGTRVSSFALTVPPAAAITITTGEIGTLGNVTFV